MMLRRTLRAAAVLAASAIVVPYAVALLSHMMWGWPRNYRRALSPRKVYMLNYAILLQFQKVKFALLKFRWTQFYKNAKTNRLLKDMPFGCNGNSLDLYKPLSSAGLSLPGPHPVIVFLYGGSWSSGDKDMYGLLCAQLADDAKAIVCCPNYSIYPKGLLDDMVQDVVDCVEWVREHAHNYDGDKDRIALVGHSAGGHLAMMAVLELLQKGLIYDPDSMIMSSAEAAFVTSQYESQQQSTFSQSFEFEEGHFVAPHAPHLTVEAQGGSSSVASGSFYMVQRQPRKMSDNSADEKPASEAFVVVGDESNGSNLSDRENLSIGSIEEIEDKELKEDADDKVDGEDKPQIDGDEEQKEEKSDGSKDETGHDTLEVSFPPSTNPLSSIKVVIGIAGVYDISDHYDHEAWRGIEDISKMARAMFGPQHFQRFSPTFIVRHLPKNTRLPAVQLIHGDQDNIVPDSSSMKFGKALWDCGCRNVRYSVIPQCDHYGVCIDLMDPNREWYSAVMGEILQAVKHHL